MFGNIGKMMKIAGEMKQKMPEMQAKLAESRHTSQAGGDMVTATVDGKLGLTDLTIKAELFESGDVEMLEDMVKAAVGSAQQMAAKAAAEAMQELTGGMEIPGMGPMLGM